MLFILNVNKAKMCQNKCILYMGISLQNDKIYKMHKIMIKKTENVKKIHNEKLYVVLTFGYYHSTILKGDSYNHIK